MATLIICDRCGSHHPAESFNLRLSGYGDIQVDLDQACQEATGVAQLLQLAIEMGVEIKPTPKKRHPSAQKNDLIKCPMCAESRAGRYGVLLHLENVHKVDKVSASRMVTVDGPSFTCECRLVMLDSKPTRSAHTRYCPVKAAA